jgi:hypothetical protein
MRVALLIEAQQKAQPLIYPLDVERFLSTLGFQFGELMKRAPFIVIATLLLISGLAIAKSGGTQGPDTNGSAVSGQGALSIPASKVTDIESVCAQDILQEFIKEKASKPLAFDYKSTQGSETNLGYRIAADGIRLQEGIKDASLKVPVCNFYVELSGGLLSIIGTDLEWCPAGTFADKSSGFEITNRHAPDAPYISYTPETTYDGSPVFGDKLAEHHWARDLQVRSDNDDEKKDLQLVNEETHQLIFSYPKEKLSSCLQKGISELAGSSEK